jgi:hypothetical protein
VARNPDDLQTQCLLEAETLAQVGAAIFPQATKVRVRLPRNLADLALAAWQRDDDSSSGPEATEQRAARHQAGTLALIGLCIEQTGQPDNDEVVCELDSWYIGMALDAADDRQLLAGHTRATSHGMSAAPTVSGAAPSAEDED